MTASVMHNGHTHDTTLRFQMLTFAVLRSKQDGANLEVLDNCPNVWGNSGPVKPHHEQLTLDVTLLAAPLCHIM